MVIVGNPDQKVIGETTNLDKNTKNQKIENTAENTPTYAKIVSGN